jgi:hypothetical protein
VNYTILRELATTARTSDSVSALLAYLTATPDATVQSGCLAAARLADVWRQRLDYLVGLQHSFQGWAEFFAALEEASTVCFVLVRGPVEEPARFLVVASEGEDRILACLARRPRR